MPNTSFWEQGKHAALIQYGLFKLGTGNPRGLIPLSNSYISGLARAPLAPDSPLNPANIMEAAKKTVAPQLARAATITDPSQIQKTVSDRGAANYMARFTANQLKQTHPGSLTSATRLPSAGPAAGSFLTPPPSVPVPTPQAAPGLLQRLFGKKASMADIQRMMHFEELAQHPHPAVQATGKKLLENLSRPIPKPVMPVPAPGLLQHLATHAKR